MARRKTPAAPSRSRGASGPATARKRAKKTSAASRRADAGGKAAATRTEKAASKKPATKKATTRATAAGRARSTTAGGAAARRAARSSKPSGRTTSAGKSTTSRSMPSARTSKGKPGKERLSRRPVGDLADRENMRATGQGDRSSSPRAAKGARDVTAEVERAFDLEEEEVPTPPSTLDLDRHASAARSGREELDERFRTRNAYGPEIAGGDIDADWEAAYSVGEVAPGGSNPTPDQSVVEDIGRAVGVEYQDTEELKSTPKIDQRDRKRWELDPASSEDYRERNVKEGRSRKK